MISKEIYRRPRFLPCPTVFWFWATDFEGISLDLARRRLVGHDVASRFENKQDCNKRAKLFELRREEGASGRGVRLMEIRRLNSNRPDRPTDRPTDRMSSVRGDRLPDGVLQYPEMNSADFTFAPSPPPTSPHPQPDRGFPDWHASWFRRLNGPFTSQSILVSWHFVKDKVKKESLSELKSPFHTSHSKRDSPPPLAILIRYALRLRDYRPFDSQYTRPDNQLSGYIKYGEQIIFVVWPAML